MRVPMAPMLEGLDSGDQEAGHVAWGSLGVSLVGLVVRRLSLSLSLSLSLPLTLSLSLFILHDFIPLAPSPSSP